MTRLWSPSRCLCAFLLTTLVLFTSPTQAIKFEIEAYKYPPAKCVWNAVHNGDLVIVTANVGPGDGQRVDIEIVDSSPEKNVYLNKRGITGEARFAITAHTEEGDVGVCFRDYLEGCACLSYFMNQTVVLTILPTSQRTEARRKPA